MPMPMLHPAVSRAPPRLGFSRPGSADIDASKQSYFLEIQPVQHQERDENLFSSFLQSIWLSDFDSPGCFCVTGEISGHWARSIGEERLWETRGSVSHLCLVRKEEHPVWQWICRVGYGGQGQDATIRQTQGEQGRRSVHCQMTTCVLFLNNDEPCTYV